MYRGQVLSLHLTPRAFLPMKSRQTVLLVEGRGVEGDRYFNKTGYYSDLIDLGRELTLIEDEALDQIERDYHIRLERAEHRRNITTKNVPLSHLVGKRVRIGCAIIEGTRISTPCRHIEQITGKPVFTAMLHRCGLNARVVRTGVVSVNDVIEPA